MTLLMVLVAFCAQAEPLKQISTASDPNTATKTTSIQALLDTTRLSRLSKQITDGDFGQIKSLIVYKNNQVVFENYYGRHTARSGKSKPHRLQSVTKSVASILIGILKDKGYINSSDQKIVSFFPEYNFQDSLKRTITIKHLLLMSSGISWNEGIVDLKDKSNDIRLLNESKDYLEYYFNKPMDTIPGTVFQYSGGCSIALGEIIKRASGMTVENFANKFLFEPLQISKYNWVKSESGQYNTGGGLSLYPKDLAKIGLLLMRKGKLNGQQIISESWIEESLAPQLETDRKNGMGTYFKYGYQWWSNELNGVQTFSARGWGDQRLVLIPELDIVVAVTASNFFDNKARHNIDELLLTTLQTVSQKK